MSGSSLRIVVPALLVIVGSVPANLPPAHAADGTIVVQRQVQPRVAYRPSMVPDPHPVSYTHLSGQRACPSRYIRQAPAAGSARWRSCWSC